MRLVFCNGTLFLLKVSSSEQCGLLCLNSNTATDELYSDDVCSGFEYNAENKNCVLGTIDESLEASETTKTVMLKYVEPWLIPVTKSKYNMYFQDWQFCTFFTDYFLYRCTSMSKLNCYFYFKFLSQWPGPDTFVWPHN